MNFKDIQHIAQRHTSHLLCALCNVLPTRWPHAISLRGKENRHASMDRNPYTDSLSSQDRHQIGGSGLGHLWSPGMEVEGVDDQGEVTLPLTYLMLYPRS